MFQAISDFLRSDDFMPHGHCFLWQPDILWLHVGSDAAIAAAYFAIPFVLVYILRKRDDMPFENIFILFASFILFCGLTHVMSIWVLWNPDYAVEGILKLLTAIASIGSFFITIRLIPRIISIPSPTQLTEVNQKLQDANRELDILYRQSKANSESYLHAIVDTVLDGLITIDEDGIVQTFNRACVRIFGYQPEEITGQNVRKLMPDEPLGGEKKTIGVGREIYGRRKDGAIFPIEFGINETRLADRRMYVATIRDISERKQAENAIQKFVAELKRSNQELDDFAYIASHDLKEPLRGLSNNAMFLKEDLGEKLDNEGLKRINRMTYLCERMERLINDLLYFSRLGRQELAVQKTNLNDVIHDIAAMMENTLLEANVKIYLPEKLPSIVCDQPRITEVFRNLITNAAKYNDKPEKHIEVGCRILDGARVFYVRDNGKGIPAQFHNDVFRIFKRLNDEDDNAKKGTGVGLTFVKKIIERHHGRIWIESEVNKYTIFNFTIPEAAEAA